MHSHRRFLDVALALAFTPACGVELSGQAALNPSSVSNQQALEEEEVGEEDETPVPQPTATKVRTAYAQLKKTSALNEDAWRYNEQPPADTRYARLPLENDADRGIYDGYAKAAMVPVTDDGSEPHSYYVVREGGVGGWEFLAGPFNLENGPVHLGEKNAGQTVRFASGTEVVVELQSNPTTGYKWGVVTTPMAKTTAEYVPGGANGWGKTRFVFDTQGQSLRSGTVYPLHFVYRHGTDRPARDMVIYLQVK